MAQITLLLADAETLVKLVVFLVIGAVWLFNYLVGEVAKGKKVNPPRPPQPADAGQPDVPPRPANLQEQLQQEIEQFLKRAQQKRRGEKPASKPAAVKAPPKPPKKPPRRLADEVSVSSSAPATSSASSAESVAQHVQKHLDTGAFQERASHMIDDLAQADTAREKHRKDVFEHKLGTLADTSLAKPAAATDQAAQSSVPVAAAVSTISLTEQLANPQNLRQAIILQEILTRPTHRW